MKKAKQIVKQNSGFGVMTGKLGEVSKLKVASLARLERATNCLEGRCSIRLSYRDVPIQSITKPETGQVCLFRRRTCR